VREGIQPAVRRFSMGIDIDDEGHGFLPAVTLSRPPIRIRCEPRTGLQAC
jgi:hypothetical protein